MSLYLYGEGKIYLQIKSKDGLGYDSHADHSQNTILQTKIWHVQLQSHIIL